MMEDQLTEFEALVDESDDEPDFVAVMCYIGFGFLFGCGVCLLLYAWIN